MIPFPVAQTSYWLALSTWRRGAFFVAVMAPVVFRTVREANPILPTVLSVNLENQHGSLLAGSIVGNMLQLLSMIQMACAAVILVTLVGQWFVMETGGIRTALFVLRGTVF